MELSMKKSSPPKHLSLRKATLKNLKSLTVRTGIKAGASRDAVSCCPAACGSRACGQ
jgi:hypothetical protein